MRMRFVRWAAPALAVGALAVTPAVAQAGGGSATSTCRGSETLCEATFSLAGGASNKRLSVRLPGTNLRLLAVNAVPAFVHGAYRLFNARYSLGGSLYSVTLDAVESIPRGSRLIMTFGHRSAGLRCGNIRRGVSFLSIFQLGSVRPGSYSCDTALALGRAWMTRFRAHDSVRTVEAAGIDFTCRLVTRLPQNMECSGGNLRVRFSGPTG